ncbi:MAG: helix-turn-helix domain-containing protein [Synergistaceae bacterium]|nr:helix-turn-helix domain-containing protein [Synergistaceae bacterium]
MDISEFVSIDEAAEILGYNKSNVGLLCRQGKFDGTIRIGKRWLIPRKSVENYKPGPQGFAAIWARRHKEEESEIENENFDNLSDDDRQHEIEKLYQELRIAEEKNLNLLRQIDLMRRKLHKLLKK